MIEIPIEIGDIVRVGRFKNKRIKVKSIEYDEYGLPLINGRPLLTMRIEKLMPKQENTMKKSELQSPEQVIKEIKQLQEKLPAALQQKVGNVFLGGNWKIAKAQGAKIPKGVDVAEPDTEWEEDLYEKLENWVNTSSDPVAQYFKKNKELLDQLSKEFPILLQPPIGEIVYRGTSITKDSLETAFRTKKFDVVRIGGREAFHFKNLDYNPNRPAQSWTLNPKRAFSFQGSTGDLTDHVSVVYATKVNRDFIVNPLLLKIIWFSDEKETVRVAGKGTFEAFVDSSVILNSWKLDPKENFIHKLKAAQPYFAEMIAKYNKLVDLENKRVGEDLLPKASSLEDIFDYDTNVETPPGFQLDRDYVKYAKKYKNSLKK